MSLTWTASTPNLQAEVSSNGSDAGTIDVSSNTGAVTYKISSNTGAENIDAALFQVIGNNLSADVELKNKITAADLFMHGNTYKIQIDATDNNGTSTIDVIITIDDAPNDAYFTDSGNKITKLSKVYGEDSNSFTLTMNTSNGGNVTYQLDPSDVSGVLSVTGTGKVTINNVGVALVQGVVASGSGYDGITITLPITITDGLQNVIFQDTTTLNRQFVLNDTFQELADLEETSANTLSTRSITYTSNTLSICSVDAVGTVTMLDKGICEIEAKNNDTNWKSATTTKRITLYDGMGVSFVQDYTPQAETNTAESGSPIGVLNVSGGSGKKTYAIANPGDTAKNKNANFFTINSSGSISLKKPINATDIANAYDSDKKAYILYVQFETADDLGNVVTTDAQVEIKGAPLNAEFDTGGVGKITKEYSPNGTFNINLSTNKGNGIPTFRLKNDPTQPSDVLQSVSTKGLATIDNANDRVANANPVMVEAEIPASNGYEGETIEIEVEITKAPQPNFGFKNTTINIGTESSMTPTLTGKLSDGNVKLTSKNISLVSINGNDIETNTTEGTTTITAIDEGDRNYKSATNTATVIVSSAPPYGFVISVPSATYGDSGLSASVELNELEDLHQGAIGTLVWTSSDPTIADVDADGNITIYKAGSVDITCTQTSPGVPTVSSSASLVVKPKPITITIDDKSKYVGETMPTFEITIPSSELVGTDTISAPTYECVDSSNAPVVDNTPAGSYPIKGSYTTGDNPNYNITVTPGTLTVKQDASLASWYHLEGVTSGNILDPIKWYNEDVKVVLDTATETAGTYDEISLDQVLWDASSITITKEDENSEDVYFRISTSGILSTNQSTTIKIDKTKPSIKSITGTQTNKDDISQLLNKLTLGAFFKPGTKVVINAQDTIPTGTTKVSGIKDIQYDVYEIDTKTGLIKPVPLDSGRKIPDSEGKIEVTLDDVGLYRVCAIAKDNAGNEGVENCSDVNISKIDIDVDGDGTNDFLDPDEDGCPDLDIVLKDAKGDFYKLNVDRDKDGIPDMNIDSNGDGIAEINVDTDKDGKPDLNLVILSTWEPTYCVPDQSDEYCTMKGIEPVINVDTGTDGIPDINIDTDGDFEPDFNVTRPGETKPYLNIGKVHEKWEPNKNDCKKDEFTYDTAIDGKPLVNYDSDTDGKPDINIDTNNDGKPDINIDINGDGLPDLEIDGDGDGEPDFNLDADANGNPIKNVIKISEWVPNKEGSKNGVEFDTMDSLRANDTLVDDDSGIQIQKPGGSFLPNFSIKVDNIKDTISSEDKGKIEEHIKGNDEIKDIYDVKLSDGSSSVQPDGSVKVRIPLRNDLKDTDSIKVIVEQKDGTYKEVDAIIKDGYIEYETDNLGKVGIIAAKENVEDSAPDDKIDITIPDLKSNMGGSTPDTSVKGNYTSGFGGAGTGDTTNYIPYILMISISIVSIVSIPYKKRVKK